MVAVSSRLAVLVAFACFAGVTGAPVQDTTSNDLSHRATHSDRAHKHLKPPVIPAPKGHKAAKGRSHKQLKEAHKRSVANMFASNPFAKMATFAMNGPARRQGGSIFKRQQALLSASATRSHLGRRDHDHDHDDHHHDDDDDDDDHYHHHHHHHHHGRDFVRVKAGGKLDIAVSRRDESSKGALGTVAITSESTNSPDKTLASMCMEPAEGKLLLDACEKKQTEMTMVHVASAVPENNSDKVVQLQVPVYNKDYMMTQDYCATYDRAPPATGSPMEMRPCGEENQSKSQMFSFNPENNELRPAKFSAGNDASGIAQVGEDEGGLTQRSSADSVQMKFVPKNVEISEPSSTSAGYTSTITATETFTSTATVTVSATPDTSSSSLTTDTSSFVTTSTTVAPSASSTMPAALDIKLETPSSISAPSASSTSIEHTTTLTSSTTAPTTNVSATSTSVDAAAVASSIAVGGESSS